MANENTQGAAATPPAAPKATEGDVPWIGNLFGAIGGDETPAPAPKTETPAATTPAPAAPAAPAKGEGKAVVNNVFVGGAKKGEKTKAKAAEGGK